MVNKIHRPYITLRVIKVIIGHKTWLDQDYAEIICLGLHTCLVAHIFLGITAPCCSIDSCWRKRWSLLFWVWDKPEGHHFGRRHLDPRALSFTYTFGTTGASLTRLLQCSIIRIWSGILGIRMQPHTSIRRRWAIVDIWPRPWQSRPQRITCCNRRITHWTWLYITLMQRIWNCTTWPSLLLDNSFLLIFSQELCKTRLSFTLSLRAPFRHSRTTEQCGAGHRIVRPSQTPLP